MSENINKHRILILDFGSQYTQLIARRVRELGVYCELLEWNTTESNICKFSPSGIILSGGPESTTKDNSPRAPKCVFEAGVPVLGICYGMQTIVVQFGGQVEVVDEREFGYAEVEIEIDNLLIHGIQDSLTVDGKPLLKVWMSHNDKVTVIPSGFIAVAGTKSCPFSIIANEEKKIYGVHFHPEVTHTHQGARIIERFVHQICQCEAIWTPKNIINDIVESIRQKIGDEKVILGLSGGMDSSVTAMLLHRAISQNLICVFIDNGLLRLNEAEQVIDMFNNQFPIIHVSAEDRFLSALKGEKDPEIKRKIIGRVFMEIFDEEALKLRDVKWFAQGTIYPDVIESAASATSSLHIIKSHHNVGGLPKKIKMGLLEPLRGLFKDEVRKIGLELGLSHDILYRHPFPGAGLGIRILGEVKKEYCDLLRHADAIFIEELRKANLYTQVSQAFAIFLPIRSVGVMGDNRNYNWVISLRAIETTDFMTAHWSRLPYDFLSRVSNRIINEVNGISRVVYDISEKPPATIEWE